MKTHGTRIYRALGLNVQGDLGPWTFFKSRTKGLVFFTKSPPLEPPTKRQIHHRNRWRLAARLWKQLTPQQRSNWQLAARKARIQGSGYNLFIWHLTTHQTPAIQRIENLTGIQLLPLSHYVTP